MKRETLQRQRELESVGWSIKSEDVNAIKPHSGTITQKHFLVKAEICRQVTNKNIAFWTEAPLGSVATDADYADVLIARESEKNGIVVEVETGLDRERKKEKVEKYHTEFIQDVIVCDPTEAPDSLQGLSEWVESKLAGFI